MIRGDDVSELRNVKNILLKAGYRCEMRTFSLTDHPEIVYALVIVGPDGSEFFPTSLRGNEHWLKALAHHNNESPMP